MFAIMDYLGPPDQAAPLGDVDAKHIPMRFPAAREETYLIVPQAIPIEMPKRFLDKRNLLRYVSLHAAEKGGGTGLPIATTPRARFQKPDH